MDNTHSAYNLFKPFKLRGDKVNDPEKYDSKFARILICLFCLTFPFWCALVLKIVLNIK